MGPYHKSDFCDKDLDKKIEDTKLDYFVSGNTKVLLEKAIKIR